MRRTVSRFLLLFFAAIAFIGTTAGARPTQEDPVEIIQTRASSVVNHIMQVGSARTSRFNAELTSANLLRPLDPKRLDSADLQMTKAKILGFIDFLGEYRDSSELILHSLEDSIAVLRSEMPRLYQETFLRKFLAAYTADAHAFDQFTLSLSEMYKEVIALQSYLQQTNYKVKNGNELEFADKESLKKYQEFMKILDKKSAEVSKAGKLPSETEKALQNAISHLLDSPNE